MTHGTDWIKTYLEAFINHPDTVAVRALMPLSVVNEAGDRGRGQQLTLRHAMEQSPRLLLSGAAGSGKTSSVRLLALTLATAALQEQRQSKTKQAPFVPLYVDLHTFQDSLEHTIAASVNGVLPVWREYGDRTLVFFIDGLEQLRSDIQLAVLSSISTLMSTLGARARWVLTCRSEALPLFRPWFSSAEVRMLRPLPPRDVLVQLRQRSGEQIAALLDGDDALIALAGRMRWLESLVQMTHADAPEPTMQMRGPFLRDWMHNTLALVHPKPADALALVMRMYHDLQTIREPWPLSDVMQKVFPHTANTAMVAQQLLGSPSDDAQICGVQGLISAGIFTFDYEQQTLTFRHPLIRALITAVHLVAQPASTWSVGELSSDDDVIPLLVALSDNRPGTVRRLCDLGLMRPAVKAVLRHDNARFHEIMQGAGVHTPAVQMAIADVLQQEGAFALARQQLEATMSTTTNDVDMLRRVAELSVAMHDWSGAAKSFEMVSKLRPEDTQSRHQLGIAYGHLGSFDAATSVLQELLDNYRRQVARVASELGTIYVRQHNYPAALQAFDTALRDVTDDVELYCQKVRVLEALSRIDEAHSVLTAAMQHVGEHPTLLAEMGRICLARGDMQGARSALDRALSLAPDDASSHAALGRVHMQLGDMTCAWASLQRAIELHPRDDTLYVDFATVCDARGDEDGALAALRKATELAPHSIMAHRKLGQLLQRRGDVDHALQALRVALQHAPNDPAVHGDIAVAQWKRGDHDLALTSYRKAIALAPTQTMYMHAMAQSYSELGRHREAVDVYNKAVGIDADNIPLLRDAIDAYEALGHLEQGDAVLQRALVHHDNDVDLLHIAARFALRRGQPQRARRYIAKALWLDRHNDQSWLQAGLLYISEGRWKHALFALKRIVDATSSVVMEAFGRAWAGAGQIDAAIRMFETALTRHPNDVCTLLAYSQALAQDGQYGQAYELAQRAFQQDAGNVDVLLHLGQMALNTDRPNEAQEHLDAAATLAPARVDIQCMRSRLLSQQGMYTQALSVAQHALGIDSNAVDAMVAAADALCGLAQHQDARELYQQALNTQPQHEAALSGMRQVAMILEDVTQAADAAQRLVSLFPKSAVHHLHLGEVLLAIGVPEAAIIEVQQALDLVKSTPQRKSMVSSDSLVAEMHAQMSKAYAQCARWSEARECAEQAVSGNPDRAEYHALLGEAFLGLGHRASAIASYRTAVSKRPNQASWQYALGLLLHQSGADKEAIPVLQQAILLNDRPEYYHALGRAFLGTGDNKSAVKSFERAIKHRPDAHHWRADLADVQARRGWHKEAIAEIDHALEVAADHPVLWRKRAELLLATNQLDAAASDVLEALRRDANDVKSLTLMSEIMMHKGQIQRALDAAERAVKLNANDAFARYQLATVLRTGNRRGEAIPHMIAATRLRDQSHDWWVELAEDYEAINDYDRAAQSMARAHALVPHDWNIIYRLGMLYFHAGEYALAETELRRVMVQMPNAAHNLACLADVSAAQGKYEEALSLARRAVEIEGKVSEHWRVLARVLRAMGEYNEALDAARFAYHLDVEHAPAAFMYGILLLDFGEVDDAVTALTAAVTADATQAVYQLCLGVALRQQVPLAKDFEEFTSPTPLHMVKLTASLQAFDRALTIDGDNPRCMFERGIALQMMLRHHDAIASFDAAAVLYGEMHPRPLSGDAAAASVIDKNDLAAHIRQRRALSYALLKQYAPALVDQRYVLAVAPLSVHDQYIYGRLCYLINDLANAQAALANAVTGMPGNAAMQQWFGTVLLANGRVVEAITALELANDLQPGSGTINAQLRDAYVADQRMDRAIAAAQRATRFDSANPYHHYHLAQLYKQTHRNGDARASIMAAITLKNDVIEWHMLLGDVCMQMGMFDNARSAYLSATHLDAEQTAPIYALSQLLVLQGRIQDAIANLEQALLRDPQNGRWYFELGQLYEQRGNYDMARAAYQNAIQHDGQRAEYYRALAKIDTKAVGSEAVDVAEVLNHAHQFNDEGEMFVAVGNINFEQGLYATALEQYMQALQTNPERAEIWCAVAKTKLALGQHADALMHYEQAIRRDPRCVEAHAGVAQIAIAERRFGDALEYMRMAATIKPHVGEYQLVLAEILFALNQKDESIAVLRKLKKFLPADVALMVRFAELAFKLMLSDDAFDVLTQLVALDTTVAPAYYLLGRIHRQRHDMQKAMAALRQAIKLRPDYKEAQHELNLIKPLSMISRRRDTE